MHSCSHVISVAFTSRVTPVTPMKSYRHVRTCTFGPEGDAFDERKRSSLRSIIMITATPVTRLDLFLAEAARINILTPGGALFSLNRPSERTHRAAIITGVAAAASAYKSATARKSERANERPVTTGEKGRSIRKCKLERVQQKARDSSCEGPFV